jgi:hypothetical protein
MSQPVVAGGAPDPLLLGGEVHRVLPQVVHREAAQGGVLAVDGHVERALGLQGPVAEGVEAVTGAYAVRPQLGDARRENPQLLAHGIDARKEGPFSSSPLRRPARSVTPSPP